VWAFKIGGKLNPLNAPPAPPTIVKTASTPGLGVDRPRE
jgi:hypothetical protein